MLTEARRCTEGIGTSTEIPEPLLIRSTSVSTDNDERSFELFIEVASEDSECFSCFESEIARTSCFTDMCTTDCYERLWFVVMIIEGDIFRDKSLK